MEKKLNLLYLVIGCMLFFASCEPKEERNDLGPVYTVDQLKSYMKVSVSGNTVTCINTAPEVISYWSTEFGTQSNNDTAVFLIPLKSSYNATLTAFCAGGKVTATIPFDIAESDMAYYSSPYWNLLANGVEGKTWVWASDIPGGQVWGNGGHMNNVAPAWWFNDVSQIEAQGASAADEIYFDLNQSHNFKVTQSIANAKPGTGQGKFNIDFKKAITVNGAPYSIGEITFTNWTIPLGFEPNTPGNPLHYTFNILKLTEDELVLEFPSPKAGPGGEGWFFMFKRKGYSY